MCKSEKLRITPRFRAWGIGVLLIQKRKFRRRSGFREKRMHSVLDMLSLRSRYLVGKIQWVVRDVGLEPRR